MSFMPIPALKIPSQLRAYFELGGHLTWSQVAVTLSDHRPLMLRKGVLGKDMVDLSLSLDGRPLDIAIDWQESTGVIETLQWSTNGIGIESIASAFARHRPLSKWTNLGISGELAGDGVLTIVSDALSHQRRLIFDQKVQIKAGQINWPAVSAQPLTQVSLNLFAGGDYDTLLDASDAEIKLGNGPLQMDVAVRYRGRGRRPIIELVGTSKPVDCQAAIRALPSGLLGGYQNVKLSGVMNPWFRFRWPLNQPSMIRLKFRGIISDCRIDALNADPSVWPEVTFVGPGAPLDDVEWLNRRFILTVREGVYGGATIKVGPGTRSFYSHRRLPKHVGGAAYLSEEILFPRNNPIDRGLISRALRLNLLGRRFVYGGSTVTQQLVKNLFLTRSKSIARKIQEVLIAKRITQKISRRRVLELYLNCIEFGRNLYGIGRAAHYYFQRPPTRLRPRESIFLAMIKPAPRHAPRMRRRGRTPPFAYWQARAEVILERLIKHEFVSPEEADDERPLDIEWSKGRYIEPHGNDSETDTVDEAP